MKDFLNDTYFKIGKYLFDKNYQPIYLTDYKGNIKMLLFTDFSEKIIYAISCVRLDDTLCLCEGSLFNENGSVSCGFYRTCSIPYTVNINTNELLSQFEMNFEQFISDGREFKTEDTNVKYAEMQSGIVFENPISAIIEYAQQNNLKIVEVVFVDPEKEYYGEIISKIDMTAENNHQGFHLGSAGSGGKIELEKYYPIADKKEKQTDEN